MDFIERTKLENEEKFKKMVTKYQIPKKYNDASKCFFSSKIAKLKLYSPKYKELKELIEDYNLMYEEMQYIFPKETGEILQEIFEKENTILGIHRTDFVQKQVLDIFNEGLKNRSLEYDTTIQTSNYFPFLLHQIYHANGFKNANHCIIVELPKEQKLPIYYYHDSVPYILPEYIVGAINVGKDSDYKLIFNPNYKKIHDYSPDGLFYDEILKRKEDMKKR